MNQLTLIFGLCFLCSSLAAANVVGGSKTKINNKVPRLEDDDSRKLVNHYNCAGKPDGNYIHPYDCTKFMSCVAQAYAYERDCATCHYNPIDCPNNKTHYDHPEDACLWAHEAGCVTDPQQPTQPPPPEPEEPTPTPGPDDCNPDECVVTGYCHEYSWCEREASDHKGKGKKGTLVRDTCDPALNLYFDPNHNDVHGGVCNFWENLSDDVKNIYNNDPNCIDPHCEWKPDTADCSSKYWYFHPDKNNGEDLELYCPRRPDGEQLLWDQNRKSCHTCNSVNGKNGTACC